MARKVKPISRFIVGSVTAVLITSCAHPPPSSITGAPSAAAQDLSNTAPVTFSHQARSTTVASQTEEPTSTTASNLRTTRSTTTSPIVARTPPGASNGEPVQRVIADPEYSPDAINRKAAEQVAWAYSTLRMTYSYTDSGPTEHIQQASTFAIPTRAKTTTETAGASPAPPDLRNWDHVITDKMHAAVTITEMDVYPSGPADTATTAQTLIRVTWTRTLSSELNAPVHSSGATTVTLQRQRTGDWLVSNNGFSDPN
jgi:hypothetical protein